MQSNAYIRLIIEKDYLNSKFILNSSGYKMYHNNIKGYNVYALWFNWTMFSISFFSFC